MFYSAIPPGAVVLARDAMATRFEVVLHGANPAALRAAAEAALDEVQHLESLLSLYRPSSEIAHVNARAAHEPVRVSPAVFNVLKQAERLHHETGGAFDITIAPLVRCWGFMGASGKRPTPPAVAAARALVGMPLVRLDDRDRTVRFERDGVMLDLGGIGKGVAVANAAEILRESGVTSALIHGGTSSVYAVGRPPDADAWKIAIELQPPQSPTPGKTTVVTLRDEALSVSAAWGKCFEDEDGDGIVGHVLDPRSGDPVAGALLAAVIVPDAADADALSTALMVLGGAGDEERLGLLERRRRTLVVFRGGTERRNRM